MTIRPFISLKAVLKICVFVGAVLDPNNLRVHLAVALLREAAAILFRITFATSLKPQALQAHDGFVAMLYAARSVYLLLGTAPRMLRDRKETPK